jgi:hypothetical protein
LQPAGHGFSRAAFSAKAIGRQICGSASLAKPWQGSTAIAAETLIDRGTRMATRAVHESPFGNEICATVLGLRNGQDTAWHSAAADVLKNS